MLRTACVGLALAFISRGLVAADESAQTPSSLPPEFGFVDRVDPEKGTIVIQSVMTKPVVKEQTRTTKVEIDGRVVEKKVPFIQTRMVMELTLSQWASATGKALDAEGNSIASADVLKRVKKGQTILTARSDKIDPAYLKALKADALILILADANGALENGQSIQPKLRRKPAATEKFKLSKEEELVLDLANKERKRAGLGALKTHEKLFQAARHHSANMARQGKLSHDLDGHGPGDRIRALKYGYTACAENCAMGQQTPEEVLESWMGSDGHRANILNDDYLEVGVGLAKDEDGQFYWTLLFARPAG